MNVQTLSAGWGKLGELPVYGRVYAQPLFVGSLQLSPAAPAGNVVLIATNHNTLYVFDADSLTQLWSYPTRTTGLK